MSKVTIMKNLIVKSRPVHITFFVTGRCNARCKMCFYWKENRSKNELTLGEIKKIAENYKHKLSWLALAGGEPFLRKDLPAIVETCYESWKPDYITIPTNALLTEKIGEDVKSILKKCQKTRIRIKLSLDGIGEIHDEIRGFPGAYEKFTETHDKLIELKNKYKNLDIGITITFSSFNRDNIKKMLYYMVNSGRFNFDKMLPPSINLVRGQTREIKAKIVDEGGFKDSVDILSKIVSEKYKNRSIFEKLLISDEFLGKDITLKILKKKGMIISCCAGKSSIVITEEGVVYPCELLNTEMGRLRENNYNLNEILNSEKAKNIRRFITGSNCTCTHECNMFINTLFNPKIYPFIVRKYFKLFK